MEDILVRNTLQHNYFRLSLIVWEPRALSNASNAELVLLGVRPQPERWTSAGHSLSASSCYWSGKIRNKLAEPGQLLSWPNPGKIPCLGNIINWVWSQGLAGALVRAWICDTAWDTLTHCSWRQLGDNQSVASEDHGIRHMSIIGGWNRIVPYLWCSINLSACLCKANIFWICYFCCITVYST